MTLLTPETSADTLADMLSMLLDGAVEALDVAPDLEKTTIDCYEEVGGWLAENDSPGCRIYPQGSFRLGTVVRPATESGEYDIDLVCWLPLAKESITQDALKQRVGAQLQSYMAWKNARRDTDGPKSLESRRRCWTMGYEGFHLDVLPTIPDEEHQPDGILLTDENLWKWQHSNPIGYADWFRGRSELLHGFEAKRHPSVAGVPAWSARTPLQRVVQILKWHCMIVFEEDPDNRPPSILITTLAARAYNGERDLFTATRMVLDLMPSFIENRDGTWWVPNPAHEGENFTDKWKEYPERRKAFYTWLEDIRAVMNDLAGMETKGVHVVFARLAEAFDRDPMRHSINRYADLMGSASTKLRMTSTGLLSAAPTETGPRNSRHTFYGQHSASRH